MSGSPGTSRTAEPTFGYLEFIEDPLLGITGGYLIVSVTGRPLEFHCTAPVQASRAQEILFGPTLRPHLLGEQIGHALVNRAAIKPALLAVSDPDLADAAAKKKVPLVLAPDTDIALPSSEWRPLEVEQAKLWAREPDAKGAAELLQRLTLSIDIAEPFDRIREAIREAQRLGQSQNPTQGSATSPTQEGAAERDAA